MSNYRHMNKQVRQAAKVEMTRKKLTQSQLAELLEISRGHLNRMLSDNHSGPGQAKTPDSWSSLLDALGLKLVAVPKDFPVPEELDFDDDTQLEQINNSGVFEVKRIEAKKD